ncbi:DUF3995 domain-containing protein [Flavobacterium sp. '19STA2R22 D10 B1']|uniref:DUF3995 domain-containing protein n=1 Tax=Flavobacterium aerium TaxID=3037261 RepID=UPI00278BCEEC|nr:DUF3995 domain-containing protein [Flavobacterium sp. '19STA2R22 D10 B1']
MSFLIVLNAIIFTFLSLLHIYWATGGKWGINVAVPTRTQKEKVIRPSAFGTFIVGLGLLLFALVTLGNLALFEAFIPQRSITIGTYVIGCIFLLRAIGDFKFIGLFKIIKNTPFAKKDTAYYTPLCLVISGISFAVAIYH